MTSPLGRLPFFAAFFVLCSAANAGAQALLPPPSPRSPHGFHEESAPQDLSLTDPSVPRGQIVVEVIGAQEQPLAGVRVELETQFESIAQGSSHEKQELVSDAAGRVVFKRSDTTLRYSHIVRVHHQGALYEQEPFRLEQKGGHRAVVHAYPVTRDIKEAFIGLRGFVLVELRDGKFVFNVVYYVFNMSRVTWIPRDLNLALPTTAEPLDFGPSGNKAGFKHNGEAGHAGQSVSLNGTFPPGQKQVHFEFQVPQEGQDEQTFELGVPPHLAELRVLVEDISGVRLDVPGFDPPQPSRTPDGKRMVMTRRLMQPGQSELSEVRIDLSGLPVPSPARWVACLSAALVAAAGLWLAKRWRRGDTAELRASRAQARQLLLQELVALERAFAAESIGPKTHEQARNQLLNALARLEEQENAIPAATGGTPSPA